MPEKIVHVINFLADRAERPGRENWRWLARAVFLARFHEDNPERALMLARRLAGMHESGEAELPIWARQMPVFIMNARGEKETAQALLEETIKSGVETMHPNEINFLVHFLCTRVLDERQMLVHPFCTYFRNR